MQPPRRVPEFESGNKKNRPARRRWLALTRWHVGQLCTHASTSACRPGHQIERRARDSVLSPWPGPDVVAAQRRRAELAEHVQLSRNPTPPADSEREIRHR
jgi:hypothetical protein